MPIRDESVGRTIELLWSIEGARDRKSRRLTLPAIVAAAIEIADAEGLEAVSMQRVASRLSYTTMALYKHVPDKAALVTLMADTTYGLPPPRSDGEGWREAVGRWVGALWSLYGRHRWILRTPTRSAPLGPHALAWFESLAAPLARAGLGGDDLVAHAIFISSAVRDMARVATELGAQDVEYADRLAQLVDPARFPTLAVLATRTSLDDDDGLMPAVRIGLASLLDGIEAHVGSTKEGAES